MGMDVYSGTLTRYYAHNWKTVAQQFAEENGFEFRRFDVSDNNVQEDNETLSPEEIQNIVTDWMGQLIAALSNSGCNTAKTWTENNVAPYYTDKPDWDAFGALLLYTAARIYNEELPSTVTKNWDFNNHPLIARFANDNTRKWSLFSDVCYWIPLNDGFIINGTLPTGVQTAIATTCCLKFELDKINEIGWQADENTILSWTSTEGYPADCEVNNGQITSAGIKSNSVYNTESLAKFAYSIFYRALKHSEQENVPIILDF